MDPGPSPASACQATPESCVSKVSGSWLVNNIGHATVQQRAVALRGVQTDLQVLICDPLFLSISSSATSGYNLYVCSVFDFLDRLVEPDLHHLTGLCPCSLQCVIEPKGEKK